MKKQRRFSPEFKRQAVEELLSGISSSAQLCRRYNISSGLLYHWKKQYAKGGFGNEPTPEAAQSERISQLEQMVGRLTMENEFLKNIAEQPKTYREKREFITNNRDIIKDIKRGCELMNLPRNSYYYKPKKLSIVRLKPSLRFIWGIQPNCFILFMSGTCRLKGLFK